MAERMSSEDFGNPYCLTFSGAPTLGDIAARVRSNLSKRLVDHREQAAAEFLALLEQQNPNKMLIVDTRALQKKHGVSSQDLIATLSSGQKAFLFEEADDEHSIIASFNPKFNPQ